MRDIIGKIRNGELTRHNDESYAEGFWDLARELSADSEGNADEHIQENVYNALWELYETLTQGYTT